MSSAANRTDGNVATAIDVQAVGCRVAGHWVLRALSFQIATGTLVGLAGSNGAGKSLLLRLCAGLARPSEGSVRVLGYATTEHSAAVRERIGYVAERAGLYERLTLAQNLDFVARAHGLGVAARAEVTRTLLDVVGLTDHAGTLASVLSPGQRRRAALAAALVHDPPLLLLDDPLAGLDGGVRLEQREVLRELRGMSKTVIVASNLLADLAALCDEILVLHDGGLVWRGTPDQLPAGGTEDHLDVAGVSAFDRTLASFTHR